MVNKLVYLNFVEGSMILKHLSDKIGHTAAIYCLSHNDKVIWAGDGNGYIVEWSIDNDTGEVIAQLPSPVYSLAYVSMYNLLIAGDMHGHIFWLDIKSKKILKRHEAHHKGVFSLIVNDEIMYSCGGDGTVTKWSVANMSPIESLAISPVGLRSLYLFSEKELLIGDGRGYLFTLDIENMILTNNEKRHQSTIFSISSFQDQVIITGSRDATIKVSKNESILADINAHWYTVNSMVTKDNILFSASRDKKIRAWQLPSLECIDSVDFTRNGHIRSVNAISYLTDKKILISGGDDKIVKIWNVLDTLIQ
jgi:WD40 repeat protein